jgi:hypothetical protein
VERTAVDLVQDAVRLGTPRQGLRAVAELRRRLDELEAWHVENAVRAGSSWSQVADALGVSKQAAHKKHAARLRNTARTSFATAARERGMVVTAEARRAVQHAAREARALDHRTLGTGHLLLGLLAEEHPAAAALERAGVTLDAARAAVSAVCAELSAGNDSAGNARLPTTPRARKALEQSLHEAVRRGDSHLGVQHVLLAILGEQQGAAAKVLERLGTTRASVRKELAALPRRQRRNVRSAA